VDQRDVGFVFKLLLAGVKGCTEVGLLIRVGMELTIGARNVLKENEL
jgi:hypothetical protein